MTRKEELKKAIEYNFNQERDNLKNLYNGFDRVSGGSDDVNGFEIKIKTSGGMVYTANKNALDIAYANEQFGAWEDYPKNEFENEYREILEDLYIKDDVVKLEEFSKLVISYIERAVKNIFEEDKIYLTEELKMIVTDKIEDVYVNLIYNKDWCRRDMFNNCKSKSEIRAERFLSTIENVIDRKLEEKSIYVNVEVNDIDDFADKMLKSNPTNFR